MYLASTNKIDQRNLMRALNDAQMAADLNSKWYKLDVTILDSRKRLATVEFGENREMEYIECTCYNTLHPFQNKHQIYRHLQRVRMLCAFKRPKFCV